jgi:hypothetical protein
MERGLMLYTNLNWLRVEKSKEKKTLSAIWHLKYC